MSDKPELKPCPFCGVDVKMENVSGSYGYTPDSVKIHCHKCNICFGEITEKWEQGKGHFSVRKQAMQKLTERWNQRADLAKPSEWISVDDRLPEKTEEVLIYVPGLSLRTGFIQGVIGNDILKARDNYGYPRPDITHWQPLPAPPAV